MIKVHHLKFSRSTRILWLLEELEEPYEIVHYLRNPQTMRAPKALEAVHTLGKAPIIEDDGLIIAESGAIIEYVIERYGRGRLAPARSDRDWALYLELLHFAEGSAMMPLLVDLLGRMTGGLSAGLKAFMDPEIEKLLGFIADALAKTGYLIGGSLTGADIQMFYVLELAKTGDHLRYRPVLQSYLERLEQRPAYRRALEVGGPVNLPRV